MKVPSSQTHPHLWISPLPFAVLVSGVLLYLLCYLLFTFSALPVSLSFPVSVELSDFPSSPFIKEQSCPRARNLDFTGIT